jgi:hypothetical protein
MLLIYDNRFDGFFKTGPESQTQANLRRVFYLPNTTANRGRKSDGPPGLKTVWQGYQQLCHAASVYELMTQKI